MAARGHIVLSQTWQQDGPVSREGEGKHIRFTVVGNGSLPIQFQSWEAHFYLSGASSLGEAAIGRLVTDAATRLGRALG